MLSDRRICLLAHNVRSLWNVGSFFRTADAFAIEKIFLTGYTGHPPRKEITKTAIGAEEWVEWEHCTNPLQVLSELKEDGWQLIALELTETAVNLDEAKISKKVCLVVGHELTGVPEQILDLCDLTVQIPMLGKKESLNVAVAAGIALNYLRNNA
jgi:23S rRNA (guanosine2251-2'-O)-methyltransferase